MNENIDLTKILKDCPTGTKFYSTVLGEIKLIGIIYGSVYPIIVSCNDGNTEDFTADGKLRIEYGGECTLFPSKDQRDWSKFTAPWYKKEKFDHKTLNPFDRVLVRNFKAYKWKCEHFSYFNEGNDYPCMCSSNLYAFCIPYNDETKHLVGTSNEAPEYYRYWED